MTTTADLTKLAEDAEKARAKAEAARIKLDEEQAKALQHRDAVGRQWDAEFAARYEDAEKALQQEQEQARQEFEAELLATPVFAAWVRYRSTRWARQVLAQETANAINRSGLDAPRPFEIPYREPRLLEDIVAVLDKHAQGLAEDEREQMQADRQAAEGGA